MGIWRNLEGKTIQTLNSNPQQEFSRSNKLSSYANDRENMGICQRGKQAQKRNASSSFGFVHFRIYIAIHSKQPRSI
ncbi:hypothetical protein HZS_6935 [Henneguya salminicola]|nr:hypothetical protein HZS_6935 [Henneguya salminicola]